LGRGTANLVPDPLDGKFSLADAMKGVTGSGPLSATIETNLGQLECKLYPDKAPNTVANFIGLAEGVRPWRNNDGDWVKKPAYDGATFHPLFIVAGAMIQGTGVTDNGSAPGYTIADEIWPDAKHDRLGLLCMGNHGPNTNGAEFFITGAAAPYLDGFYTIFGECGPEAIVSQIHTVKVRGVPRKTTLIIKSIRIHGSTTVTRDPGRPLTQLAQ
jgi:peptidyl-prolyl cis-trans isomerase A (cyclophilin A)